MIASERLYPIRRPLAAACAGAAVAILGGLIGLGGAEFRLPILIGAFARLGAMLEPHGLARVVGPQLPVPLEGKLCLRS